MSVKTAHQDVHQALADLAELEQASSRILAADHPYISGGKVLSAFTESGRVIGLTDDGPKLAAIDRLLRISDLRGLSEDLPLLH